MRNSVAIAAETRDYQKMTRMSQGRASVSVEVMRPTAEVIELVSRYEAIMCLRIRWLYSQSPW
jgi:hypothetical protein